MIDQFIIIGLVNGLLYALIAMGFSFIFGVSRILNLAHSAFFMVAAYTYHFLAVKLKLSVYLSLLFAVILTVVFCIFPYTLCLKSRIRENVLNQLILTVAIALLIQGIVHAFFGTFSLGTPSIVAGFIEVGGVRILAQHILVMISAVVLYFFVWLLLKKTKLGIAIRSAAQDEEASALCGVNLKKIYIISGVIGIFLVAVAGVIAAPFQILTPWMWGPLLPIILAIAIVGGLGSIKGSFLMGLIFGFIFAGISLVFPAFSYLKECIAFIAVLLIFLMRPEGLFGIRIEGR